MAYSLEAAAEIYREALRDRVRRYALLYICEGVLLALAGVLAVIYPLVSSAAIGVPLGWLLIATAAGILLTASAGTLRILQLRRRTRKDLKRR